MSVCFARYEAFAREGHLPPENVCPSLDQMAAFKSALDAGDWFVDFAIFGPYGARMVKRMRMVGKFFAPDGSLVPMEVYGPDCYWKWLDSANVLQVLVIMFDVLDFGTWQEYMSKQATYNAMYGPAVWPLQYQTECRARREKLLRMNREAETSLAALAKKRQ